jgi:hypothetical protein
MRMWKRLSAAALALVAVVLICELLTRALHLNRLPSLPYLYEDGATVLPANADLTVRTRGYPPNRYVTDGGGARVADRAHAATPPRDEVLVVGDSQALGYMVEFGDTFASRVAAALVHDRAAARMLAAPASHPESFAAAIRRYGAMGLPRQRLVILTLNLGNDLDELFAEPHHFVRERPGALKRWLMSHSFVYMDALLASIRLSVSDKTPAGLNPILYLLDADERVTLARAAVDAVDRLAPMIPSRQSLILILPQDFQVDPAQFEKYRRYYASGQDFARWHAEIATFSQMLDSLEGYVSAQLERRGHRVLRVSELLRGRPAQPLFADTSHHLTAAAHALIADAVVAAMDGS